MPSFHIITTIALETEVDIVYKGILHLTDTVNSNRNKMWPNIRILFKCMFTNILVAFCIFVSALVITLYHPTALNVQS